MTPARRCCIVRLPVNMLPPSPKFPAISLVLLALFLLAVCCGIRSDAAPCIPRRMLHLPRLTVWAWERREDLRSLPPHKFAVAYLDQTIVLGLNARSTPRRDPIIFPSGFRSCAWRRSRVPSSIHNSASRQFGPSLKAHASQA